MNINNGNRKRKAKKHVCLEETFLPALFPDEFIAEAEQNLFCNEIILSMLKNPNFECAFRRELSIERIIEIKKNLGEDCSLDYEKALEKTTKERNDLLKMLEIKDEEKKRDEFDKACQEHEFLQEFMRLLKESNFSINVQNLNVHGDTNVTGNLEIGTYNEK